MSTTLESSLDSPQWILPRFCYPTLFLGSPDYPLELSPTPNLRFPRFMGQNLAKQPYLVFLDLLLEDFISVCVNFHLPLLLQLAPQPGDVLLGQERGQHLGLETGDKAHEGGRWVQVCVEQDFPALTALTSGARQFFAVWREDGAALCIVGVGTASWCLPTRCQSTWAPS